MNTNARSTATRTLARLAPRFWLAFGVLAFGGALAAWRPAAAQEEQAQAALATSDELHDLVGNPAKAAERLGWAPTVSFDELVQMLVDAELARLRPQEVRSSR